MQIRGGTFIVTGGASGLGAECVRSLARQGANVVVCDVQPAVETADDGGAIRYLQTDVTSETDAERAVDAALEWFGDLRGLVNCAGIAPAEKIVGRDGPHALDSFRRAVSINLIGTFNMIRLAAFAIEKRPADASGERGIIINTASIAAFEGQVGQAAYAASKGGVAAMTLPLARELARYGIRVVTIAPGIFETPMMAGMPTEVREALGRNVPFPPRLGRPAEFAALVTHIIENSMLNGETIRLDGALRMGPR
ncbi:3-hydroxy-2-methylbutyryl-CoA dehydrogenase [Rhizobium sp. Root708]|uniref:3-hydroxyacyl-CoA dehydrogenase n=1 Tax=Rhizobium sp. Root708 TaxID=1736592 RepID=UPI0006F83535|nr:3-hydroxyacyl-CoA dehydrogenase [Rhizobium sp. Root708]KRB60538.1 3-hydroxy-2-methylbutyryl-CoA dehydrogenase [Rhizobium sp. Root708]